MSKSQGEKVTVGFPASLQKFLPNEPILIYQGEFILGRKSSEIIVNGVISFEWVPEMRVVFRGKANVSKLSVDPIIFSMQEGEIRVRSRDIDFGRARTHSLKIMYFRGE